MYLLGVLVLVGSALAVRRVPIAQGLKMFVAWVLIFGAAFVVFTLKDEFLALGRHIVSQSGSGIEVTQGGAAAIPALVGGDLDIAYGAWPSFLIANAQGLELRAVRRERGGRGAVVDYRGSRTSARGRGPNGWPSSSTAASATRRSSGRR